jgi:membrane protease YdiL (CAAX protease family)
MKSDSNPILIEDNLNINLKKDYKTVCAKLGIVMSIYFVCRLFAWLIIFLLNRVSSLTVSDELFYVVSVIISSLIIYGIPTFSAVMLFRDINYFGENSKRIRELYKKPKRLAKSLGTFPAMYGLGQGVNLLTILVFFLISLASRSLDTGVEIQRFLEPVVFETPHNIISALIMVFILVLVAPVVEEFLVRGIMYDVLKPYGNGVAIIITSLLFGLMHGSLQMLFYTTALGFALGYVRYATDSLFVVTVLHMLVNAVAAGVLFLLSLDVITGGEDALVAQLINIYVVAAVVLVVIGIFAFFKKIPIMKRYKISNEWVDIKGRKKIGIFFISVPVLIMLVLAIDEHLNNIFLIRVIEMFK